jgi:hypothetical protein
MTRPSPPAIEPKRRILYWLIGGTCAALGIVLILLPLFRWHAFVGATWLVLATIWFLMPVTASTRRRS